MSGVLYPVETFFLIPHSLFSLLNVHFYQRGKKDIRLTDNKFVLNSLFVIQNFVHLLSLVLERKTNNMRERKTMNANSHIFDEDVWDSDVSRHCSVLTDVCLMPSQL